MILMGFINDKVHGLKLTNPILGFKTELFDLEMVLQFRMLLNPF